MFVSLKGAVSLVVSTPQVCLCMYVCMYVCLYPPQLLMSLPRSTSFFSTTVPVQKYNYRINKIWMKETGNMEEKCNKSFNER